MTSRSSTTPSGTPVGDKLLVAVAERLSRSFARATRRPVFGGDEFTVLLGRRGRPREAEAGPDRILWRLREPFALDGHPVIVCASIGIAIGEPPNEPG